MSPMVVESDNLLEPTCQTVEQKYTSSRVKESSQEPKICVCSTQEDGMNFWSMYDKKIKETKTTKKQREMEKV